MRITIVSRRGGSYATTIPKEIAHALGVHATSYIYWTWNTLGHAELRHTPPRPEPAARTPTPQKPPQARRRRRET